MRGAAGTGAASPSPSAAVSPPATAAAALDSTLSRDSDGRWADAGLALALLRWLDALVVHAMVEPAATMLVHSTAAELAPHAGADSGGSGGGEGGGATFCEVALAMQLLLLQEGGGAQPAGGGAADGGAGPLEPARQLDELLTRAAVWCERPFLEPSPQQQPSRGTPTLSSRGGSLLSGRDPSTRVGSFESTGSGQDSAAEAAGTWQLRQLGRAIGRLLHALWPPAGMPPPPAAVTSAAGPALQALLGAACRLMGIGRPPPTLRAGLAAETFVEAKESWLWLLAQEPLAEALEGLSLGRSAALEAALARQSRQDALVTATEARQRDVRRQVERLDLSWTFPRPFQDLSKTFPRPFPDLS